MTERTKITVTLPYELPTFNEVITYAKMMNKGRSYASLKRRHTGKVAALFDHYVDVKFKWVELTINWGLTNRRKDPDNVASGIKFILDGMVKAGVIQNDGWKYVHSITHTFSIEHETAIDITILGPLVEEGYDD